jgi:hypothetical protein
MSLKGSFRTQTTSRKKEPTKTKEEDARVRKIAVEGETLCLLKH